MKLDLVVSTMLHQIDRNLQTQAVPALAWRAGEILQGKVMLAAGEALQIRLDNGMLLNALPAGGVLLNPGATVTLRVAGRMDGQLVMQLLDQQVAGGRPERPAVPPTQPQELLPGRAWLDDTPQGRAVGQAMDRMRLPFSEATARTALEVIARYPGLEAEKAVFLAANGIAADPANVEALSRLTDNRAMLGGELMALADLLTAEALETAQARPAPLPGGQPPPGPGGLPQALQGAGAVPAAVSGAQADAFARLEYFALSVLGAEAAEEMSAVAKQLRHAGLAEQALTLVLEGLAILEHEFSARAKAFAQALPGEAAPEAEAFLKGLAAGAARAAKAGGFDPNVFLRPYAGPEALPRAVAEIARLFVRIDPVQAAPAEALARAGSEQNRAAARIAREMAGPGAVSPGAARQAERIIRHVQLLEDISQYAYRQIPVELDGRRTTAELYVLSRGRAKGKARSDSASILVALDTANLGRIEALVQVSRKALRLCFGVEHEELAGFFGKHAADLAGAMQAIGYRLADVRTQIIRKPVTPLTVAQRIDDRRPETALDVRV